MVVFPNVPYILPVALTSPFTVKPDTSGAIFPPITVPELANVMLLVIISLNIPLFIKWCTVDMNIITHIITR